MTFKPLRNRDSRKAVTFKCKHLDFIHCSFLSHHRSYLRLVCTILFWSHRGRPYLWDSLWKADITHVWFYIKGDRQIVSEISLVALEVHFRRGHSLSVRGLGKLRTCTPEKRDMTKKSLSNKAWEKTRTEKSPPDRYIRRGLDVRILWGVLSSISF